MALKIRCNAGKVLTVAVTGATIGFFSPLAASAMAVDASPSLAGAPSSANAPVTGEPSPAHVPYTRSDGECVAGVVLAMAAGGYDDERIATYKATISAEDRVRLEEVYDLTMEAMAVAYAQPAISPEDLQASGDMSVEQRAVYEGTIAVLDANRRNNAAASAIADAACKAVGYRAGITLR